MKNLTLVRRDDCNCRIELVKYQDPATLPYFFGQTQAMIDNHRTAAVFPRSVWKVEGQS